MTPPSDRAGATLTIDLGAIARNYRSLRERVAPARCAVVVKADAYGLGVAQVAPALAKAGAETFFVATLDEAIELRGLVADAGIAVLDGALPGTEAEFIARRLTPVLNTPEQIAATKGSFTGEFLKPLVERVGKSRRGTAVGT